MGRKAGGESEPIAGLKRQFLLPAAVILGIVSILALGLIFQFAARQNRQAGNDSLRLLKAILQERQLGIEAAALDCSRRNGAYAHVMETFDRDWVAENIWVPLSSAHLADFVAVLDGNEKPLGMFSEVSRSGTALWNAMQDKVHVLSGGDGNAGKPAANSAFYREDGRDYLLATSPIVSPGDEAWKRQGMLVVAREITPQEMTGIASLYGIRDLRIVLQPPNNPRAASLRLASGSGGPSYLAWFPPRPGDEWLRLLLPGVFLLVALFFFLTRRMISMWDEALSMAIGRENEVNALFSAAADAILIVDRPGNVRRANASAQRMFGRDFMSDDEVPVDDILRVAAVPGGVSSLWSFLRISVDRSAVAGLEASGLRGGETFPLELSAGLARLQSGEGMVIMVRDITERKRAEAQIIEGRRLAEAASQAKSTFLANMSHEFRTPLNAMLGFSEVIFRETFGPVGAPKYRDYASDIHSSAAHLLRIVQNVLDLSELEAGGVSMRNEMFSPRQAIDKVAAGMADMAGNRRIALAVEGENPAAMFADRGKFSAILGHLLDNAIRYAREGSRVQVRLAEDGEDMDVYIEDAGTGIDEATQQFLFQPFFRGAQSYIQRKGAGLGLPICRRYAELMGGSISLEWSSPEGSCFRLRLPVRYASLPFPSSSPDA